MSSRLNAVSQLLECQTLVALIYQYLWLSSQRQRYDTLLVAMIDITGQNLECHYLPLKDRNSKDRNSKDRNSKDQQAGGQAISLTLPLDDYSHPLAHVVQSGTARTWVTLNRGERIEHEPFRRFIRHLPHNCGLHALPLFTHQGQICGVIALFAEWVERLLRPGHLFDTLSRVFQSQLKHLLHIEQLQQQQVRMRQLLDNVKTRQSQLDEMFEQLAPSQQQQYGLAQDHSKVDSLPDALEALELAILRQRLYQLHHDKQHVADSLGISLRTLIYRTTKYREQL